jgi:hypothetical protein
MFSKSFFLEISWKLFGFFGGFLGGIFREDFLEGIFWEKFFGRNFLGGFFGRYSLGGVLCLHW